MAIWSLKDSPQQQTAESSLVLTEETTTQFDSTPSYGATLRAACHSETVAAMAVYELLDKGLPRDRAWSVSHCRSIAWFVRHDETGEVRIASSSCHLRWCPLCARARRNYIAREVSEWLDHSDHPKFLTLTLKHTDEPLKEQIDHLYSSFRELRRRKDFDRRVTGGIWFFHIKRARSSGQWHPHLHCLVTGLYIPQSRLRHMWIEITTCSEIVDIRGVDDHERAAFEAARYAASPGSLINMDLAGKAEMVDTLHGRRICGTWGTGRDISLRPEPTFDKHLWQNVGSFQAVVACHTTDRNAQAILLSWKTGRPLPDGIYFDPSEKFDEWFDTRHWINYELETAEEVERSPP